MPCCFEVLDLAELRGEVIHRLHRRGGQAVQAGQLADRVAIVGVPVEVVLPAPEDLAELEAPVAEVVVADDLVAERSENPGQALADDRRADVADVHRLGDVRRREVDDDGVGRFGRFHAQAIVTQQVAQRRGDPAVIEPDVEEPGPGDLGGAGHRREVDRAGDLGGQLARVRLAGLRDGHAAVGLVVAELRVGARPNRRGEVAGISPLGDGVGEAPAETSEDVHGSIFHSAGRIDRNGA